MAPTGLDGLINALDIDAILVFLPRLEALDPNGAAHRPAADALGITPRRRRSGC